MRRKLIITICFSLMLTFSACGKKEMKVVTLTPATDLNPGESVPLPEDNPQEVRLQENCVIRFANLTGKDIKSLSFSLGGEAAREVLGTVLLRDGSVFTWDGDAMALIGSNSCADISVSAVAKDGTQMNFEPYTILDPESTDLVLTKNEEGYKLYLQ